MGQVLAFQGRYICPKKGACFGKVFGISGISFIILWSFVISGAFGSDVTCGGVAQDDGGGYRSFRGTHLAHDD